MKANYRVIYARLALTVVTLIALPAVASAQEKGAESLMKLNRHNTVPEVLAVQRGDTAVLSGPKCKDTLVQIIQPLGKGGRQETATVQRHECSGCDTQLVTEGVGKQAKDVVKHVSQQSGSEDAYCCVVKK